MKQTKRQKNESLSLSLEKAANEGHYLERLENIAVRLDRPDILGCVLALKQIHMLTNCKPSCSDAVQADISDRILGHLIYRLGFSIKQASRLWYGVHWDSREAYNLKFPYSKEDITVEMRQDKGA